MIAKTLYGAFNTTSSYSVKIGGVLSEKIQFEYITQVPAPITYTQTGFFSGLVKRILTATFSNSRPVAVKPEKGRGHASIRRN